MTPATWPRAVPENERLLVVDPQSENVTDTCVKTLPSWLRANDLVVVNDAATLPASLHGRLEDGREVELRLTGAPFDGAARAIVFGAGDWTTPTETRPLAGHVSKGDRVIFGDDLSATITRVGAQDRLIDIVFDREGAELVTAIYAHGHPVQYAYLERPLSLWHVQNRYASRPWAAELPSAGHVLTWSILSEVRKRGARVVSITHAAGLSSTGDAALDRLLPLPERYEILEATVRAIRETRVNCGRVVAIGTSVVRALEGATIAGGGEIHEGSGVTELRIDGSFHPRVVSGLLTGMHELGASHRSLLDAFAAPALLDRAYSFAEARGYHGHEFGDVSLILAA